MTVTITSPRANQQFAETAYFGFSVTEGTVSIPVQLQFGIVDISTQTFVNLASAISNPRVVVDGQNPTSASIYMYGTPTTPDVLLIPVSLPLGNYRLQLSVVGGSGYTIEFSVVPQSIIPYIAVGVVLGVAAYYLLKKVR